MKKLIYAMLVLTAAGCSNAPMGMKVTPPPPEPPAVPAKQNVQLDPAVREAAKNTLLETASNPDPVMRANAIEALQDTLGEEAFDSILRGLDDSDPLVRFAASMAVGKLRLRASYPKLIDLATTDGDYNVKVGTRFALHRLGDVRLSHELELLARNDDRYVRGNVALALGLLGEPSALRVLRPMTNDKDPIVRLEVAEAMWRLGDKDGLTMLVTGTISEYPDDQAVCVLALAQPRDARVMGHIRGKLTSDYPEVALIAARAMGMLGSEAGYGVALNHAKDADPRLKSLSALAFGQIGRADAEKLLTPMLKEPNLPVRLASAAAILQLKPSAP